MLHLCIFMYILFCLICMHQWISYYKKNKILEQQVKDYQTILFNLSSYIRTEVKNELCEVEKMNKQLCDMAKIDGMTGAINKAGLLEVLELMIRGKKEFSMVMFDIDYFKKINDTEGHVAGDNCIRDLSTIIKKSIRETDIFARYGGDEFVIIFPRISNEASMLVAEKLRQKIDSKCPYTISIGVVTYLGGNASTQEVIEIADKGLYTAKQQGRNNVQFAGFVGSETEIK